MTLPVPFAYPAAPHERRHGPKGYANYAYYKPFLRDEFSFRCVYCLEREMWYPNGDGSFSADHFTPKKIDKSRENDYDNLVYACVRCNSFKRENLTPLDPTKVAFSLHFRVKEDGHIEGLTDDARDLIELLDLDTSRALKVRQRALRILMLKQRYPDDPEVDALLMDFFGFPPVSELPDLSRYEPPEGNSRLGGVKTSYYEKWKEKTLPEMY